MFHARAWRRAVLLIAASLALAPMLFQPIPAAASATGTLFGITLRPTAALSSIEPATGATTSVADLSLPPPQLGPGFGISMADDPATHRLFLLRVITLPPPPINNTTVQLVTVDTAHPGAAPTAITLTQPLAGLAFDPSTGTLFGVTAGNCCPNTLPISIVKVDPTNGNETTVVPVTGDSFGLMAIDPATHLLYVTSVTFSPAGGITTLLTVDTVAGVLLRSTALTIGLRGLVFDPSPSPGALFGTSFCCPAHFVKINPTNGSEAILGTYDFGMFLEPGLAIDTATHTVFTVQDVFDTPMSGPIAHIASINDQTGAGVLGQTTGTNVPALAFEPILITITPASLKADVQKAAADGSIKTKALANSLLNKLDRAAEARVDGNCKAAARIYEAFIDQVNRQSGKKIAAATAAQLASEAQFLIDHCP